MADSPSNEQMTTLGFIAYFKSLLPFGLRGWTNELGLYVRERRAGNLARLQAGGKFRSYLDAWSEDGADWDVKKFDSATWATRFDPLVDPTYQITIFLMDCVSAFEGLPARERVILENAIQQLRTTGEWVGLPKIDASSAMVDRNAEEQSSKIEEPIARKEADAEQSPDNSGHWAMLARLYEHAHRYGDSEHALRRPAESQRTRWPDEEWVDWFDRIQLGKLYFSAFVHSLRGRGVPIWGYEASEATAESLGYSSEQLAKSARENLIIGRKHALDAGFAESERQLRQANLAILAIDDPSAAKLENYDSIKIDE
jgi:hypothetical protein